MDIEYKILPVHELNYFLIRDIRESVIIELKERIKEGYNPARPLTVVEKDNKYYVVDGNHRLKVLNDLGIEEITCVIHKEEDPYTLAVKGNEDENTYSPMDLFDWIELIGRMMDEGLTQKEIGNKIGWSHQKVSQINNITNNSTHILEKIKLHQVGRVDKDSTLVEFNFTEGWFRESGLYKLSDIYQEKLINDFIADKCSWNNNKVKSESAKYRLWQEFINTAKNKLVNQNDLKEVINLIESGTFRNEQQLLNKINDFNSKAENKLINGDCLIEMEKLEDNSIDLIITDPPYGIDYSSNRSQFNNHITKEKIANDSDLEQALKLTDDALEILNRKTKDDAHIYLFTGWRVYPDFLKVVEKYFNIKNLIIWDKGNHGTGDLEGTWGNRYEMIIFASKGNRKISTRKADILQVGKVSSSEMIHPTQKPTELIKQILEVSAHKKDTVIDPFMGSGSTIKAIKEYGDINYIGIELDRERFDKATTFIGGM